MHISKVSVFVPLQYVTIGTFQKEEDMVATRSKSDAVARPHVTCLAFRFRFSKPLSLPAKHAVKLFNQLSRSFLVLLRALCRCGHYFR